MALTDLQTTQTQHNLPLPQTRFIGRRQALDEVKQRIATCRLLTITGSGGSGKTRLALQVAYAIHGEYMDGVCWVDLAALVDPTLLPQTVAAALHLTQQPDHSCTALITKYLHNHKILLVLDNCEHLRAACAALSEAILADDGAAHMLATSRTPLGVEGEQIWVMPMLALPAPNVALSVADLQQVEAIQLFDLRARAAAPLFNVDGHNVEAIAQICRRLDGLPLAIELAAARINVLTPKQIAARLDDSMRLLTRGAPVNGARHPTLRAALDWSFDLLTVAEQSFFTRLAVFAGSFALDAVECICPGDGLAPDDLLDLLASLVEKSLVTAVEQGDEMRYRLLEPIRQYAVERLRQGCEERVWRARHAACYLALAERIEPALHGLDQKAQIERLAQEHDNFRAALHEFATTEQVEAGLRLGNALFPFWRVRGFFSEGQRWLETFLQRSPAADSAVVHINACNSLARLQHEQSNFLAARDRFAQSLALARMAAYAPGIEVALVGLGIAEWELGNYPAARAVLEEGVQHCRTSQNLSILARGLRILALVHWSQGELFTARACCTESLALARQMGDAGGIAGSLFNLALLTSQQGEYAEADRCYAECLLLNRQLGNEAIVADILLNLGSLAIGQGNFAAATAYVEEAAQIHNRLGDQGDVAYSLASLADIDFYRGDYAQARTRYQAALARFQTAGNKRLVGRALGWLGRIACREGDLETAARLCADALTLRTAIGHKAGITFSLEEGYAELALALGQPMVAARLLAIADGLYEAMSRTRWPVEAQATEARRAKVHAQLGEVAFATAWGEGQAMSMEQAVTYALNTLSPTAVAQPRHELRIYAFGPVRIYRGEHMLTAADWVYTKARALVPYLLCHPGATREQIGVEFWPDASTEQVRKRFSAALAHARNALGRKTESITLVDGRYSLNRTRASWFDVEVFEARLRASQELLQNGKADSRLTDERRSALLEEAIDLYQGDFAEDMLDDAWPEARRTALREAYLAALLTLGRLHMRSGQIERASTLLQRAINKEIYLEEAHIDLIRCYIRLHQRSQALRQYEVLVQALAELNVTPSPESQSLIERVRRNQPLLDVF